MARSRYPEEFSSHDEMAQLTQHVVVFTPQSCTELRTRFECAWIQNYVTNKRRELYCNRSVDCVHWRKSSSNTTLPSLLSTPLLRPHGVSSRRHRPGSEQTFSLQRLCISSKYICVYVCVCVCVYVCYSQLGVILSWVFGGFGDEVEYFLRVEYLIGT